MKLDEALELTGFEICKFEPCSYPCERCNSTDEQLYFRSVDYFSEDGQYYCDDCIVIEAEKLTALL